MAEPDPDAAAVAVAQRLAEFRSLRREVERSVLPLATSVDGRAFACQASLHDLALRPGGYVTLAGDDDGDGDGRPRLGQIIDLDLAEVPTPEVPAGPDGAREVWSGITIRAARGTGIVLGGDGRPFHDAEIRPAPAAAVETWLAASRPARAGLEIGELALAPGVPFTLDAGGFDRHTFLCGQSGSGKTYSLGLVLERLLLETSLRIVVLDPNSDHVRLAETRAAADPALSERYATPAAGVVVRRAAAVGTEDRLRLRFAELEPASRAALLRLDPIRDRLEYAELTLAVEAARETELTELADLLAGRGAHAEALGLRARNLGRDALSVWARSDPGSVFADLERPDWRCLVVDLGSLGSAEERELVAEAVLGRLWERRAQREPLLIVVDEAHNVCPQVPLSELTALATEHAIQIAGEGRKFGLYLLVSTQRPQKVHENVISQCDNLLLMRMNSEADLRFVGDVFSFVPRSLVARASAFCQGEALVAGKIASHAAFVRFGARISEEGGADIPADWAAPPRGTAD